MGASEQFPRHHAPRIQIGAVIDLRVGQRLFRRHVRRRPQRCTGERDTTGGLAAVGSRLQARCVERLRDAEVSDHGCTTGEQDVLRFDVTVHHAVRVRIRQRPCHVPQDADRLLRRDRAGLHAMAQRLPVNKRHRVVRNAARISGGKQRHDVRLLQARCEPHFAREALHTHPLRQLRRDHLEHDRPSERGFGRDEDA